MSSPKPQPAFNWSIPAIGLVVLAALGWLHATGSSLYIRALAAWMFIPEPDPFYDLASITAWQRCWQHYGFDVYTNASWAACGYGPIIYSPLWLRLTFLPSDPIWTNWLGTPLVVAFLLSLGLLPQSPRPTDRMLTILATFSCPPVFAMERANVDLLIFLLAVGAAFCLRGILFQRILGYLLMLIGGLLKFYPMVLLLLLLRERLRVAVLIGVGAAAIAAGVAFAFLDELHRLTAVPSGAPFHFMWGARNIPTGLPTVIRAFAQALGAPPGTVEEWANSPLLPTTLAAILWTTAGVGATWLATRPTMRASLAKLTPMTHQFLLVGAVLIVGCFFAGQNINYRSIFLLLVMPGSLTLAQVATSRPLRNGMIVTTGSILCVLWELTIRDVVAKLFGGSYLLQVDSLPIYTVWVVKELAWWWLETVLLAVLLRFVMDSRSWISFRSAFTRQTGPAFISG
jgi:hypothetical protein